MKKLNDIEDLATVEAAMLQLDNENPKEDKAEAVHAMFSMVDENLNGEIDAYQIQTAHEMMRMGGISIQQVICLIEFIWKLLVKEFLRNISYAFLIRKICMTLPQAINCL